MNKFTQHIPNFCEGFEPECFEFSSTEELLNSPFILQRKHEFERFEMSGDSLLGLYDGGSKWWVLGRIEDPYRIDLPKWGGRYDTKE